MMTCDVWKTCDVCGKSLEVLSCVGGSYTVAAISISATYNEDVAAQIFGPYEPKEYNICYPCYLKSLGVPPRKTEV